MIDIPDTIEVDPCPSCGELPTRDFKRKYKLRCSTGCSEVTGANWRGVVIVWNAIAWNARAALELKPTADEVERMLATYLPVRTLTQVRPPQVKPLVWQRNGNHWAGGHGYVVRKFGREFTLTVRNQFDRNFTTVAAAKEAAQADHNRRILDALV